MPLQDLTPQLRTRLNRMERAVGAFILLATLLLLCGFGSYIYKTAKDRGWFQIKPRYFAYAEKGDGFAVGDKIKLMGFEAGQIVKIEPEAPKWHEPTSNNVYIEFEVLEKYFGYIWTEGSMVKFNDSGFLGKRELDLTKGTDGHATYIAVTFHDDLTSSEATDLMEQSEESIKKMIQEAREKNDKKGGKKINEHDFDAFKWRFAQDLRDGTNLVISAWQPFSAEALKTAFNLLGTNRLSALLPGEKKSRLTAVWDRELEGYVRYTGKNKPYELDRYEPLPLGDRLQAMVSQVQAALPSFLNLTNQIAGVLSNANQLTFNAAQLTSNLNVVARDARLAVTNLSAITEHLKNPDGSLGQWLIPTNLNQRLDGTLLAAGGTLTNLDTNLVTLNLTLANLAGITSNLNNQVQANTNILSNISSIVVHTDEFVQGLKRFWLFRRTFAKKNTPPKTEPAAQPIKSPKAQGN